MQQLTLCTIIFLAALSLTTVQRVQGCTCAREHPQTIFCRADFVATVRVKSEKDDDRYIIYKVKVNKMFKPNPDAEAILKENGLKTASIESMCGVSLKVGETYVISGRINKGEAYISLCDISIPWNTVTRRQRKDFKWFYHRGCRCKIMYTPWWRKGVILETAGGTRCLWESTPGPEICQEKFGVCMKGASGCSWHPSGPYKNCIKEHQRQREQQRQLEP